MLYGKEARLQIGTDDPFVRGAVTQIITETDKPGHIYRQILRTGRNLYADAYTAA